MAFDETADCAKIRPISYEDQERILGRLTDGRAELHCDSYI